MAPSAAERTLPPEAGSVAAARRFVEEVCASWDCAQAGWTVTQLVSELATNAVLHARTSFTVELSRAGDLLRLCVRDGSPAAPTVRRYGSESTTGRGLRLVDSLAATWGVERLAAGKVVWLEVPAGAQEHVPSWEGEDDLEVLLGRFGDEPDPRDVATARARDLPRAA